MTTPQTDTDRLILKARGEKVTLWTQWLKQWNDIIETNPFQLNERRYKMETTPQRELTAEELVEEAEYSDNDWSVFFPPLSFDSKDVFDTEGFW